MRFYSTTFEVDQKYHTNYHQNFIAFMKEVQEKDLTVDGAMTDPKETGAFSGKTEGSGYVSACGWKRTPKAFMLPERRHQTGAVNSHEHLIMPTVAMGENDKEYAVSFAVPSDAEGIKMIYGRQSCDTRKLEKSGGMDCGNCRFGGRGSPGSF